MHHPTAPSLHRKLSAHPPNRLLGVTHLRPEAYLLIVDTLQGLVYEGRPTGRLTPQKMEFARSASEGDKVPSGGSLLDAVQQLQPSALIGAAAKQNAFTADTIKALTKVGSSAPFARTCLLQLL